MFTIGVRLSARDLLDSGAATFAGGFVQVFAIAALGFGGGLIAGLDTEAAILIGFVAAISSTMIALRSLEDAGEIESQSGKTAVGWSLIQDFHAVPMIALIPILADSGGDPVFEVGLALVKALALVCAIVVIGNLMVPNILWRFARWRSRELFLLAVLAMALGAAAISSAAGLSLAFGAFLAGLVISESELAHQTLRSTLPLRDVFAVVFFVGIGMLVDPASFIDDSPVIIVLVIVGMLAKVLLIAGILVLTKRPPRTALSAAVALGQMGEFSFVLATAAMNEGLLSNELNSAILAAVILSMAISPLLFAGYGRAFVRLRGLPLLSSVLSGPLEEHVADRDWLVNHAVIAGYDEVARPVVEVLTARGFKVLVIDEDPLSIRNLREKGVDTIQGDPSLPTVLERAELGRARVLLVTNREPRQAEAVVGLAKSLNPRLDVIVRGSGRESHYRLLELGSAEVVHDDLEVGLEFLRHALHRFGLSTLEVRAILQGRRQEY